MNLPKINLLTQMDILISVQLLIVQESISTGILVGHLNTDSTGITRVYLQLPNM